MAIKDVLKELGSAALNGIAGVGCVQTWRDFRPEAACREIDSVVRQAFRDRNEAILGAVSQAFANEIRDADSAETQNHLNDLLWHFKTRVSEYRSAAAASA